MGDRIKDLLDFDALSAAEKITGQSYKEDNETSLLGLSLAIHHNERKAKALQQTDDSWFGMTLAESIDLHQRLGFDEVLCDDFMGNGGVPEAYRILWHADGILATIESYGSTRVNVSKAFYNVEFDGDIKWSWTSSGRCVSDHVWVGDHNTREGLRSKLVGIRAAGRFLNPWVERPFLWLLTYMDIKVENYDHEAITAERISRLPGHVREALQ